MRIDKTYFMAYADSIMNQAIDHKISHANISDAKQVEYNLSHFKASDKDYMLSKSAIEVCEKIVVKNTVLKAFSRVSGRLSSTVGLIGHPNFLFRYGLFDGVLTIVVISANPATPNANASYFIHRVHVNQGKLGSSFGFIDEKEEWESLATCLRIIIFLELSETTQEILKPNHAIGSKKNGVYNNLTKRFTYVNSKWNIESLRIEGFWVSGHFRLQYYKSEDKHRLIFIKAFRKHGYIRKAKS